MSRPLRIALIALGVLVFLAISGLLTRFLSIENLEREDDLALIKAQAAGDAKGMLAQLHGCRQSPTCVASVKVNLNNPRLHRAGEVKILQLESPTSYSLFGATGKTRLAWTVIGKLPVVQCVQVKRTGNFLTGISVRLVGLSAPIIGDAGCSPHAKNEEEEIE
jgi:hypothetical protein